jgi:DNA topoisomerase-1
MAQIGDAETKKKFASLMNEQNIEITLEEALNLFLLQKFRRRNTKKLRVSNGRYGPYIRHGAAFISLPKGENPLDVDINRAKELMMKKHLLMHNSSV